MRMHHTRSTWRNTLLWVPIIFNLCQLESQGADSSRPTAAIPPPRTYAPERVPCPENLGVRNSSAYPWPASTAEQAYVSSKAAKSVTTWEAYLSRVNLTGFDVQAFLKHSTRNGLVPGRDLPNVAFSISGGGNRALLYAASILDAFDTRNPHANQARTGGILQLANFASGLSASSWLLASWAEADFIRFTEMAETAWRSTFTHDWYSWKSIKHYPRHYRDVQKKKKAGFRVSMVDIWGRALSRNLLNDPDQGRTLTMSSTRQKSRYIDQSVPFPILLAISKQKEGTDPDSESPIYEFTPEDINVWHPAVNASFPIDYLGSQTNGLTGKAETCVTGFDNLGFLMGASSNLFSYRDGKEGKKSIVSRIASVFVKGRFYEGLVPNLFKGQGMGPTAGKRFPDGERDELLLADGAMAQEKLPLFPFLQPSRMVDTIIALDSAVDGGSPKDPNQKGYPDGTSMLRTSMKLQQEGYRGYKFTK
ncbi:hypothetical protein, variant 2 [Puccinia striiformis f. sp. tritici PST-78]|nr:hypothetical protein, variant 2 [Puccinia striiformis f. sp. tritici PST-78]